MVIVHIREYPCCFFQFSNCSWWGSRDGARLPPMWPWFDSDPVPCVGWVYSYFKKDNLVSSTGLIMWIGHRKEIRKLTFRALALRRNVVVSPSLALNARNVSFQISLRWPIHIINPVDETKLSCYTSHRRSTTVSLETYPSISKKVALVIHDAWSMFHSPQCIMGASLV